MTTYLSEIMGTPLITVRPGDPLTCVPELLKAYSVHALPVVDDEGCPVGVISSTDLVAGQDESGTVADRMSIPPHTVEVYLTIRHAAEVMCQHRDHQVVVTHHGKAVGVVSAFDLMKLLSTHRLAPIPGDDSTTAAPKAE